MRMSDWSSDVCSSDLFGPTKPLPLTLTLRHHFAPHDATDPDPVSLRRALKLGPRLGKSPEQIDDDIAVESKTAHFLARFLRFIYALLRFWEIIGKAGSKQE